MLDREQTLPTPTRRPPPAASLAGTRLTASSHLTHEERALLESAALSLRPVRAGHEIVREGEDTDLLLFVVSGWACRYKTTWDGQRQIVALIVPGDTANLDALLFGRPDSGVRALSEVSVAALTRERALALAVQHPGIARTFTWLALVENAALSQWALSLGRQSAQQRLAHLLCELSARLNDGVEAESSFELPLTQKQIADALGLTPVHVNRTIQHLRAEGLIITGSRSITIPDVDRLRQYGDFNPTYLRRDR